ncbi:unnamed protein product [Brassicogethes aeneus]|uniref:C2H2-type domain-containing protein n=1 Tax=Brassicogethes aeneus TaxID=1431903 RepID=A0A9P0B906_BRAAE|nr:unnamed protein product [Brassicogethes aeneus]
MDPNNTVCPVCTLYLRPGITLKSHLASHPKHKVIEALVKISSTSLDPKIENGPPQITDANTPCSSSQVNTAIVNQSWNHSSGPLPPNLAAMQGNHVFIYQQSMSTTAPQGNVLNVNPLAQQYVIPTVFNPQMMPYLYQQQQVIMSSNACVPPLRALPFELPSPTDCAVITEEPNDEVVVEKQTKLNEVKTDTLLSEDIEITEIRLGAEMTVTTLKPSETIDDEEGEEEQVIQYTNEELQCDQSIDHEECIGSPKSNNDVEYQQEELNKACQTQTSVGVLTDEVAIAIEECEYEQEVTPEFYYLDDNVPNTSYSEPTYSQNHSIYTTSNILQSSDFMDMDGMQVIINDFTTAPIISQVDSTDMRPDRSSDLMTIGDMVTKQSYNENRDFEESVSRESSNVNIKADECMPPRGELSGQESIGEASDIGWNRIQYHEGPSGLSTNAYDLIARDTWEASDSSDVEISSMQSRNAAPYRREMESEAPAIINFSEPPINFKCSTCSENFLTSKEMTDHEMEKHQSKRKVNLIGAEIGKTKVKKLIVKPKTEVPDAENNFVFTNKLKLETQTIVEQNEISTVSEPNLPVKVDVQTDFKVLCAICDCVLENAKALKVHKQEIHNITNDLRHRCTTCNEAFPNEFKYTEHLKIHPLECRICGKLFYRKQNFQLHMKRHLGLKPFKCELCNKSFVTKQKHDEHKNTHTGDAPIKCSLCNETFRRHSNLIQHRNRHHFNLKKVKDYICQCGEIFHSKKKLAWHKEIHDAKPKACTKCSEKFVHMSSLTRHMRRAHNEKFLPNTDRSSENVECPICKGVYLRSSLEVHIRNHSGARPYQCLICNKDFTTKWNLKLHKWTHASRTSKPFKCDQCRGAFIRESDYISHMNSHKSIRPYTCNFCGAQFIRKYNCQRHVKEHETGKTFNCQICGKSFHRSYYLKDHMRVHSGVRPYSCHICGKTSTTKSNHNKHVQIHHAREPVNTEN